MKDHFSKPAFRVVSGTYRFGYKLQIVFHLITLPLCCALVVRGEETVGSTVEIPVAHEHSDLGLAPVCVFLCFYSLSGKSKRQAGGSRVGEAGESEGFLRLCVICELTS